MHRPGVQQRPDDASQTLVGDASSQPRRQHAVTDPTEAVNNVDISPFVQMLLGK
jgi:hypothetical protein